jgi:hypothetical protein
MKSPFRHAVMLSSDAAVERATDAAISDNLFLSVTARTGGFGILLFIGEAPQRHR